MIGTRAGGRELDDPAFTPFWEAADAAGAVVYLHPGSAGASPRYEDFGLVNGLARVEDSTVTLARLLYAGVPARYPGRQAGGRARRRRAAGRSGAADPQPPDRSRGHGRPGRIPSPRLYFDSVVFDPGALEFLVAGRPGPGSCWSTTRSRSGIDPRAVVSGPRCGMGHAARILGGNAARLFVRRGGTVKPVDFDLGQWATLDAALALLAAHGDEARVLAGGQSLVPLLNFRLARPGHVVDIGRVAGLGELRGTPDGLVIGAMVRQSHAERAPAVAARCPLLAAALPWIAHPPIRARGTICGSLAHADPAAELPSVAVALDATFVAVSASGRREIPGRPASTRRT